MASKIPPGEVKVLTEAEAIDLRMDNTRTKFEGWKIQPAKGGAVVTNDGVTASGDTLSVATKNGSPFETLHLSIQLSRLAKTPL